jgi:superfamily II DNA/RNA helicase
VLLSLTRQLLMHRDACVMRWRRAGGAEARNQLRELDRGCDLLVATPGRLVDFIEASAVF